MTSLLFESALRATLIVAFVAVVLKTLRVESPAIRHSLWTGVLILMLLLPALVAWGPKAPLPVLPTEAAGPMTSAFSAETTNQIVAAAPLALWVWQTIVPGAYLVGLITLLFRLGLSMSEVRALRREARPDAGRLTHERCASPIVVGYVTARDHSAAWLVGVDRGAARCGPPPRRRAHPSARSARPVGGAAESRRLLVPSTCVVARTSRVSSRGRRL